jgi:hypothetical protein
VAHPASVKAGFLAKGREKALTLSTQERGLLIDRLVETLDNEPG